jgi:hypothetical protein
MPGKFIAALLILCGAAAMAAGSGEIPQPNVHVGDLYRYRSIDGLTQEPQAEFTHRVVEVNDREIVIQVRNSKNDNSVLRYFNRDWNLLDNGQAKYEPYYSEFKFPMSVGMTWSQNFTSLATNGNTWVGYLIGKVLALEKVTVPAGTYDAFRIERNVEFRGTGANAIIVKWRITTWYAPEVGRFVRREDVATRDGRMRSSALEQLLEYVPGKAAETALNLPKT